MSTFLTAASSTLAVAVLIPSVARAISPECSEAIEAHFKLEDSNALSDVKYVPTLQLEKGIERTVENEGFENLNNRYKYSQKSDKDLAEDARLKLEQQDFTPRNLHHYETSALYERDLGLHVTADVEVKKISKAVGYGVFALSKIEKGAFIGEYAGILRAPKVPDDLDNPYLFKSVYWQYVISAKEMGNVTRFINHSVAQANAIPVYVFQAGVWHVALVAKRTIEAGEQILFDYGNNYWRTRAPLELASPSDEFR